MPPYVYSRSRQNHSCIFIFYTSSIPSDAGAIEVKHACEAAMPARSIDENLGSPINLPPGAVCRWNPYCRLRAILPA